MSSSVATGESESSVSETRFTRAGRRIVYRVNVLQHPEKARACGQGPKSSTDRRPVDPPPIVDLRIYEEESDGKEIDITYSYRANFFMFASIENARPIAHGRLQSKEPNTGPLLTGAPVSGISHLERPEPAGYFIFPDLSVRHEGRYRLTFTLYEEIRDPALEDRAEPGSNSIPKAQEQVHGRCVVKSRAFTVYSAKKFPGLSESTSLSRCVAEQGCRVRIRRDVRMRRRDPKDMTKLWNNDEDEGIDVANRQPQLPHQQLQDHRQQKPQQPPQPAQHQSYSHGDMVKDIKPRNDLDPHLPPNAEASPRPRSLSTVSTNTYGHGLQRASAPDLNTKYHQGYSQTQHTQHPMQSPHSFDQSPLGPSHIQPPYMQSHPMTHLPQQMLGFQSNPPSGAPGPPPYGYPGQPYYSYSQPYGYPPHPPPPPPPQQHQMQSQIYHQGQPHMRHDSLTYVSSPQHYHAPSATPHYSNHMASGSPLGSGEAGQARSASVQQQEQQQQAQSNDQVLSNGSTHGQQGTTSMHNSSHTSSTNSNSQPYHGKSLPPLQMHPEGSLPPVYENNTIDSAHQLNQPPIQSRQAPPPPSYNSSMSSSGYDYRAPPPQYISQSGSGSVSSKRSYGSTFDTQHINQRLQSGARPGAGSDNYSYTDADQHASDDEDNNMPAMMEYRRADGTFVKRQWPKLYE